MLHPPAPDPFTFKDPYPGKNNGSDGSRIRIRNTAGIQSYRYPTIVLQFMPDIRYPARKKVIRRIPLVKAYEIDLLNDRFLLHLEFLHVSHLVLSLLFAIERDCFKFYHLILFCRISSSLLECKRLFICSCPLMANKIGGKQVQSSMIKEAYHDS